MADRVVMRSHGGVGEISAPRRHVASLIEKGWTLAEPVESKPDPKPAPKRRAAASKKKN